MNIWVVWPTVNYAKSKSLANAWSMLGYRVAILVNEKIDDDLNADAMLYVDRWNGFPKAANILCSYVINLSFLKADIVVVIGDDIFPDEKTAIEIGRAFEKRFPDFFGVMQPTGDRYGFIDRCAISPWIGRTFIQKTYNGNGPYYEGYYHYFSDHELQLVAEKLGVFQQRMDISQYHDHWQRNNRKRPLYLQEAERKWKEDSLLCKTRIDQGFPGAFE